MTGSTNTILPYKGTPRADLVPEGAFGALNRKEGQPFSLDLAKAKQLLTEAGYPDGFSKKMILSANDIAPAIAQHVATNAAKVGIKLELEQMADANLFTRGRNRDFEVQLVGWGAGYPDADAMVSRHATNPDPRPEAKLVGYPVWRTGWQSTDINAKAEAARLEQDPEKRAAIYRDIQDYMLHNGPMAYIYQTIRPIAVRTSVKGFVIAPFNVNYAQRFEVNPMRLSVLKAVARQASSVSTTLLGLLALTFFMGRMLPNDPVLAIVGDQADQSTYDMVHHQLGLDKPLYVQFYLYIRSMLSGDFGNALFTGHRVADDLMKVFPATVELATFAIIIGVGIGVPLGIVGGGVSRQRHRSCRPRGRAAGLFQPGLLAGTDGADPVLRHAGLGGRPGPARCRASWTASTTHTGFMTIDALLEGDMEVFWNAVSHIVLPGSILGYGSMAYISRMTRSFMLEQMAQEYIVAARVKGLSGWAVIRRHAFRNILVQLVTVIALAYAFLLEGAVLTETVFAWPGFGHYLVAGLLAGDMNAVLACVLIVGVIFIGLNLLTDLLYRLLDPRTR